MTVFILMVRRVSTAVIITPGKVNMSKISETPRWENEIHALTRGEKVEGGRGGAANIQASQLGNRTAFLKNELDALGTLIKSGDMPFASEEAAAAAINEGKIPDGAVFSVR
ncbi:TPA: hypothetical protein MDV35_000001, partial [Klebsiella pneumoniae]|nr:hypothetical protein [Klebsiella pneumoniae]